LISNTVQRLTCPRQRPSGPSHHGLVSGQLCLGDRRRADHAAEGFLSSFDHRHWLVGHPVPAEGFRPPHGRPTRWVPKHPPGPRRGFHVPHTRVTAGLGALFTPRPRGAQRPVRSLRPSRAPSARGQVLSPRSTSHLPKLSITGRRQGFTCVHPPGFLPGPVIPGWNKDHLGHTPRAPHPADQGSAEHAEAGDGHRALARSYRTTDTAAPPSQ